MKRRFFQYLKRRFSLFRYTVAILNLTTLFSVLGIVLMLLYTLADVKPYIKLARGIKLGMFDFEHGIPVPVRIQASLPDSSFFSAGGALYRSPSAFALDGFDVDTAAWAKYPNVDTITAEYKLWHWNTFIENDRNQLFHIKEGELFSGMLHVQTERKGWRLLLVLPQILYFSLFAFSSRQIARLLKDILSGTAFSDSNYRRLRNIGWGVIAWQSVLIILYIVTMNWIALVNFHSTRPDFHLPVQLSQANLQYDVSLSWLIGGYVLLILAYAFKKGNQLQHEQDLTV